MKRKERQVPHVKHREFCRQVAKLTGMTLQDSNVAINAIFRALSSDLAHHKSVSQIRFGCFTVHYWPSREGHTIPVKKGNQIIEPSRSIKVPGRYVPVLRPSIYLKKIIKKGYQTNEY